MRGIHLHEKATVLPMNLASESEAAKVAAGAESFGETWARTLASPRAKVPGLNQDAKAAVAKDAKPDAAEAKAGRRLVEAQGEGRSIKEEKTSGSHGRSKHELKESAGVASAGQNAVAADSPAAQALPGEVALPPPAMAATTAVVAQIAQAGGESPKREIAGKAESSKAVASTAMEKRSSVPAGAKLDADAGQAVGVENHDKDAKHGSPADVVGDEAHAIAGGPGVVGASEIGAAGQAVAMAAAVQSGHGMAVAVAHVAAGSPVRTELHGAALEAVSGGSAAGGIGQAHVVMAAGPKELEVGVLDGTHGWLKVRAEMGTGGVVNAALTGNAAMHDSLKQSVPAIASYLQTEAIDVGKIVVHRAAEIAAGFGPNTSGRDGEAGGRAVGGQEMGGMAQGSGSRREETGGEQGMARGMVRADTSGVAGDGPPDALNWAGSTPATGFVSSGLASLGDGSGMWLNVRA